MKAKKRKKKRKKQGIRSPEKFYTGVEKESPEVEIKVSLVALLSPSFYSYASVKKKKRNSSGIEINFSPVAIPFSNHQSFK